MSATFDFMIPIENKPSMQWQAKLFHFSCMTHMHKAPIIMVMGDESQELLPGLKDLVERGGDLRRAPSYVSKYTGYKSTNSAGSLKEVESDADYVVLCDSDMIFVRPMAIDAYDLEADQVSFEWIGFMTLDHHLARPFIRGLCDRADVSYHALSEHMESACGGVPHVVPAAIRVKLADEWLYCQRFMVPNSIVDPPHGIGIPSMWSLVLATLRLRLNPVLTNFSETNDRADRAVPEHVNMIHYAYDGATFSKRDYAAKPATSYRGDSGTIDEAVCEQIRSASEWYGGDLFA